MKFFSKLLFTFILVIMAIYSMETTIQENNKFEWQHDEQPSIAAIWKLANDITPDNYIKYFEKMECFNFENVDQESPDLSSGEKNEYYTLSKKKKFTNMN